MAICGVSFDRLYSDDLLFGRVLEEFRARVRRNHLHSAQSYPFALLTALHYGLLKTPEGPLSELWGHAYQCLDQDLHLADFPETYRASMKEVYREFRRLQPAVYSTFRSVIESINYVRSDKYILGSSPKLFGSLFVSRHFFDLDLVDRIEHLIHELYHHELFLLNTLDPLLTEASHHKKRYSVFVRKKRPAHGRLHAAYVFFRLANLRTVYRQRYQELFEKTLRTLDAEDFTPVGRGLFRAMQGKPYKRARTVVLRVDEQIFRNDTYGDARFVHT